jgi:hypothetical protein
MDKMKNKESGIMRLKQRIVQRVYEFVYNKDEQFGIGERNQGNCSKRAKYSCLRILVKEGVEAQNTTNKSASSSYPYCTKQCIYAIGQRYPYFIPVKSVFIIREDLKRVYIKCTVMLKTPFLFVHWRFFFSSFISFSMYKILLRCKVLRNQYLYQYLKRPSMSKATHRH